MSSVGGTPLLKGCLLNSYCLRGDFQHGNGVIRAGNHARSAVEAIPGIDFGFTDYFDRSCWTHEGTNFTTGAFGSVDSHFHGVLSLSEFFILFPEQEGKNNVTCAAGQPDGKKEEQCNGHSCRRVHFGAKRHCYVEQRSEGAE